MKLKLQHEGMTLFEVESDDIAASITIGRSSECEWHLPDDDKKVSRRHAVVFRRNDHVLIRDLQSANGTYFKGKRIDERALRLGDCIAIGSCSLVVEKTTTSELATHPHLVMQTGDMRGRRLPLADTFTIGSDPEASLPLNDPLISRLHATIHKEQDAYVLYDLGSKNGTAINGRKLPHNEAVPLKAGDRIYVAHYCLRFDDGGILHRPILRYGAAGAAALLVVLCTIGLRSCRPGTERLLARAYTYAADEQLDRAEECVHKASQARLSEEQEDAVEQARTRIRAWQATREGYNRLCASMETANLDRCRDILVSLQVDRPASWDWNPAGAAAMKKANSLAELLDSRDAADRLLTQDLPAPRDLKEVRHELEDGLAHARLQLAPPDLTALISLSEDTMAQIEERLREPDPFAFLAAVTNWPPDLEAAQAGLRAAASHGSREAQDRAAAMTSDIDALYRALKQYRSAEMALHSLDPPAVLNAEVSLPPADSFKQGPLRKCRRLISERAALLRECAKAVTELQAFMRDADSEVTELAAWRNSVAIAKVLSCDTLDKAYVDADRDAPSGEYDRYLGIENFRRFCIVELAGRRPLRPPSKPFPTILDRTLVFVKAAASLVQSIDGMGGRDWTSGKLRDLDAQCRRVPVELQQRAQSVVENTMSKSGRPALIGAGIAVFLAGSIQPPPADADDWRQHALALFQEIEEGVGELSTQYRKAAPSERKAIGQDLLAIGLPGDHRVDRAWKDRPNTAR